jgi:hypothetical protein
MDSIFPDTSGRGGWEVGKQDMISKTTPLEQSRQLVRDVSRRNLVFLEPMRQVGNAQGHKARSTSRPIP